MKEWMVVTLLSVVGKEVIIIETFLEFFQEVLKGIVREIGAYFFQKNFLVLGATVTTRNLSKVDRVDE